MNQEERFANKQKWALRVSEYQSSGMTQQAWCSRERISVSTLRYWIRKLSQEQSPGLKDDWLRVCVSEEDTVPTLMNQYSAVMDVDGKNDSQGITICSLDFSIHVPFSATQEYLLQLLQVVKCL